MHGYSEDKIGNWKQDKEMLMKKSVMENICYKFNQTRWNILRHRGCVILCCLIMAAGGAVSLIAQSGKITTKDQKAAAAITAAKKALGGEKNIDGIKSLILTGTSKALQPDRSYTTFKIEIRMLLPDSILWINKTSVGESGLTMYSGVSKGELRDAAFFGTQQTQGPERDLRDQKAVNAQLDRFAYLLMGALLKSDPIAPITIAPVSGTADKFSMSKAEGVLGEMEFDSKGKYPSLIRYKETVRKLQPISSNPVAGRTDVSLFGRTEIVDAIIRFKDRVATDGVLFPRTISYESRGNIDREMKIEKVLINPKISLEDFELPK
jgi:hypothetical protein